MNSKTGARLAWSIWGVEMLVGFSTIGLSIWNGDVQPPNSGDVPVVQNLLILGVITIATVGTLVASRQPENPIGWLMSAMGGSMILTGFAEAYAIHALMVAPGSLPFGAQMAWINQALVAPAFLGLWVFVFVLFPNGQLLSPRWRLVVWLGILSLFGVISSNLTPGPLSEFPIVDNPFGIQAYSGIVELVGNFSFYLFVVLLVVSAASLVVRYRRSEGEVRQQLKWIVGAALFMALAFIATPVIWLTPALSNTLLWPLLFFLVQLVLPLAIGISVLRYRLWDIDILIRRTLTYSLVTVLLLLAYFVSVIVLEQLFGILTGAHQNELVTVLSTLAIAALFVPVRNRIQAFIDRRFYRKKYDAQQVLNDFAKTVRDETDLEKLTGRLMQVVDETMQPKSLSVWLSGNPVKVSRERKRETL